MTRNAIVVETTPDYAVVEVTRAVPDATILATVASARSVSPITLKCAPKPQTSSARR